MFPEIASDLEAAQVAALMASRNLDALRSRIDLGDAAHRAFQVDRRTSEFRSVFAQPDPLVTCVVATYNRADELVDRSLASLRAQTHSNLQIVVVGDRCTDDTAKRVAGLRDSRIEYVELTDRAEYPEDPRWRWMVAGGPAMNEGLRRAEGAFVTHLDDDDRHEPHRVETLVAAAQAHEAEMLWHPFHVEREDGWHVNPAREFASGMVTTSSIFYHSWFRRVEWDPASYLTREPGDAHRIRRIAWLGPVLHRHPLPLLWHHRERRQQSA